MLPDIEREQLLRMLSSVAASYTRRELDRRVYDQLMASPLGQSLKRLSNSNKYALEFVVYATSAILAERSGQSGPLGQYLKEVLTDVPSEIARRMINGAPPAGFDDADVRHIVSSMSDSDFEELANTVPPPAESGGGGSPSSGPTAEPPSSGKATKSGSAGGAVRDLADYLEDLRSRRNPDGDSK